MKKAEQIKAKAQNNGGKIIPFANYPVRPVMVQGESFSGFLYRFLSSNGHKLTRELLKMKSQLFREIADESNNKYFLAFQEILGDRVSIESENWHGRKPFNIGNDHFVTPNYRTASVRMCPFCIKEYGIHFTVWELHCITACPFHRCGLLENCAKCGGRFTWLNIYPSWRCQCGIEITAIGLKKANPRIINLANLLVNASDVVVPLGAKCPQSETDNEPYTLYEVLNAIDKGSIIARSVFKPDKPFDTSLKNEPNINRHPLTVVAWVAQILTDTDE